MLHFDEMDSSPFNMVECQPGRIFKRHTVTAFELYDKIADLMNGNIKNLHQFVVKKNSWKSGISRIYMIGIIEPKSVALTMLDWWKHHTNKLATSLLNKTKTTDQHYNIMWPLFHKHSLSESDHYEDMDLSKYDMIGSAFFFKETREASNKTWRLCDITPKELL